MPRFWPFCLAATLTIIVISCGGSSSPTSPSSSYITPHNLQMNRTSSWGPLRGSGFGGFFLSSIKNTGAGCASSTTVSVQFSNEAGDADGTAYQMKETGATSLRTLKIRPQEIVALTTIARVPDRICRAGCTYVLNISANSVNC